MDDATLSGRLRALRPPSGEEALERAKVEVRRRFDPPARPRRRASPSRAASPRVAAGLLALGLALSAFALLTPPGKAMTTWVEERLGFGDPGGPPTLTDLRQFAEAGNGVRNGPAHVLLRRPTPGFGHYELVTFRMADQGKAWPANGARCYELNFPEERAIYGPSCALPSERNPLLLEGPAGGHKPGREPMLVLYGKVAAAVETVEVSFDGDPVAVDLAPIPEYLVRRFGIPRPFKFFTAFLSGAEGGGIAVATARDATGQVVDRGRRRLWRPSVGAQPRS